VAASGLPVVVARPSIVVGDGTTGWTPAFSALYLPLRAFARGLLERVPADPGGIVDVVGLDYVAGALVHLLDAPDVVGRRFHLVAGDRAATVADVIRLAARRFSQPEPTIAPLRRGRGTEALVPYFDVRTRFDDAASRAELEPHGISAQPLDALFERLMDYAEATRWGRLPTTRAAAGAARDRLLAEAA
jgi:long-chain acyl-CoA synthetase